LSDFQATPVRASSSEGGILIPILIGAVLAQTMASVFLLYQLNHLRNSVEQTRVDLAQAKEQTRMEIAGIREASTTIAQQASQTAAETLESVKAQLEAAQRDARGSDSKKRAEAEKKLPGLERELQTVKEQMKSQDQKLAAASEQALKANDEVAATKTDIGKLSSDVDVVKTGLNSTNSEVEKQKAEMKRVQGDLNQQSALIARSGSELDTLKKLGEREYYEFKVPKDNNSYRAGPAQIKLKSVDAKKNRYSVEVRIDDKTSEKKDKSVNELLQFHLARDQYLELVVYELQKNLIVGYVSAPKAQPAH
jgi:chromosome segregation ATPase